MPACQLGTTIGNFTRLRWWMFRRELNFLFFRVSKDLSIRASYGNPLTKQLLESKKDGKDQEKIQSSTAPDPGYHMGKYQEYNKHS